MTVYPSKRDLWLVVLLWAGVAAMLWGAFVAWESGRSPLLQLATPLVLLFSAAFVVWILYGTCYLLSDDVLVIRSGPFRWRVPLDAIEEVFPTRNPLSSPACSLDRLHIRYAGSRFGVMVSPRDKSEFLGDLAARSERLEARERRLVRKGD